MEDWTPGVTYKRRRPWIGCLASLSWLTMTMTSCCVVVSPLVLPPQTHHVRHYFDFSHSYRRYGSRRKQFLFNPSPSDSQDDSIENLSPSLQEAIREFSFLAPLPDSDDDTANTIDAPDPATIQRKLVEIGASFDSYKRRFDFGGVWVRNASLSHAVEPYLLAHGLDALRAQHETSRTYTQRYVRQRQIRSTTTTIRSSLGQSGPMFSVDTDFGRRVQVYDLTQEWTELAPRDAVLFGTADHIPSRTIRRKTTWNNCTQYVTTSYSPNGGIEETTRYLEFGPNDKEWRHIMERCFMPAGSRDPITGAIQCREVFERVYGQGETLEELQESARSVLTSPVQRVRGCVANVQVRTTLVPLSMTTPTDRPRNFRVWLDGEADAMISRGLLGLLSRVLAGGGFDLSSPTGAPTAEDVLQMNPERVADYLGLRQTLTKGRNDGLASIMRVVQHQIRGLLGVEQAQPVFLQEFEVDERDEQRPTVAMLLSGGVDSAVALNLLVQQNYNVTAFYLKIWLEDELSHLGKCPWEDDFRMCQAVCEQAGVPLETVSLQEEYKDRVISYTVHAAERGRTPNPDIMCNSRVKFGCFYEAIEGRGFDFVASGHYAQLNTDYETGQKRLLRAPDPVKDQSYFLCALTQEQLERVIFPVGCYEKSRVRELAEEFDMPNKNRPDSQGLCFLGKVKFDEFLAAYLGERPGDIVDAKTGDVIGRHKGVWYHTVGQRKGIGKVLDPLATCRGPWYVVAKNPERDIVFVSNEYDEDDFTVARSDVFVEEIQWIAGSVPNKLRGPTGEYVEGRLRMKIRHGPTIVDGTVHLSSESAGNVKLDNKDGGLAPGQYVVFYAGDTPECFGGGVISERHWARFMLSRETAKSVTN